MRGQCHLTNPISKALVPIYCSSGVKSFDGRATKDSSMNNLSIVNHCRSLSVTVLPALDQGDDDDVSIYHNYRA